LETPGRRNVPLGAKRMMGFEPTTFCMASRRSSQLSYIRVEGLSIALAEAVSRGRAGPRERPAKGGRTLTLSAPRRRGGVAYAGACKALYTGSIPVVASGRNRSLPAPTTKQAPNSGGPPRCERTCRRESRACPARRSSRESVSEIQALALTRLRTECCTRKFEFPLSLAGRYGRSARTRRGGGKG
jgi:hypothetical protein